jgi:hypothetical protein
VCILVFIAVDVHAEFYRWVDQDGKEFFSNDPEKVPREYRAGAIRVEPDESRVSVGGKPVAAPKTNASTALHKDKNGRGEEYWRKRAANLRLKLRDQQDDLGLVLKQLDDLDRKPVVVGAKKNKKRETLEKKRLKLEKDIARIRRLLEVDLPEEARRADAYPGWLRE